MYRPLALLSVASAVLAQTTVVDVWIPAFEEVPASSFSGLVASVVNAAPSANTYAMMCAKGEDCAYGTNTVTLVEGPSTIGLHAGGHLGGGYVEDDIECDIKGVTQQAVCTIVVSASIGGHSTKTRAVTTLSDFMIEHVAIPVTAGAEKLTASPGGAASPEATGAVSGKGNGTAPSSAGGKPNSASGLPGVGSALVVGAAGVFGAVLML